MIIEIIGIGIGVLLITSVGVIGWAISTSNEIITRKNV